MMHLLRNLIYLLPPYSSKVMGYVQKKVAALRGNKWNNGKKTPQREGGNLDFV